MDFWLRELRTAELLVECAGLFPQDAVRAEPARPLLAAARSGDLPALERKLAGEQEAERERDRVYWQPLRAELERLRQAARSGGQR